MLLSYVNILPINLALCLLLPLFGCKLVLSEWIFDKPYLSFYLLINILNVRFRSFEIKPYKATFIH